MSFNAGESPTNTTSLNNDNNTNSDIFNFAVNRVSKHSR